MGMRLNGFTLKFVSWTCFTSPSVMQGNNSSSQGTSIYPFLILAFLSLVAVIDNRSPMNSLRPDQPNIVQGGTSSRASGIFEIKQRIWEDPFKDTWFHENDESQCIEKSTSWYSKLEKYLPVSESVRSVLIVPVVLPDRQWVRDREVRSRRRYAIHQAMSVGGYRAENLNSLIAIQLNNGAKISVERFGKDGLSRRWHETAQRVQGDYNKKEHDYLDPSDFEKNYDMVYFAYVKSGDIVSEPLGSLRAISDLLSGAIETALKFSNKKEYATVEVRIIGPSDSEHVFKILGELHRKALIEEKNESNRAGASSADKSSKDQNAFVGFTAKEQDAKNPLVDQGTVESEQVYMFSPVATADFETLNTQERLEYGRGNLNSNFPPDYKTEDDRLKLIHEYRDKIKELTGFSYIRTVHNDSSVFKEILKELKTRRIISKPDDLKKVALITESDTSYGRSMTANFLIGAQKMFKEEGKYLSFEYEEYVKSIRMFPYLSGIDGELSGRQVKNGLSPMNSTDGLGINMGANQNWSDPIAHGNHQIDYVRRLADQIMKETRKGEAPIRAIGIFGKDVYDKLLLMRALKPVVGEVLFFTTDLDARLWHLSEIDYTRNMIVGSSHGLVLNEDLQHFVPPFRDSYQTSVFATVLLAVNAIKYPYEIDHYAPQVFEIGKNGPVYLRGGKFTGKELKSDNCKTTPLFPFLKVASIPWIAFWWIFSIFCMLAAIVLSKWCARKFIGSLNKAVAEKVFINAAYKKLLQFVMVFVGLFTLGMLFINPIDLEPLSIVNGTSSWPGYFLNIFNSVLAVSFGTYIGVTRINAANRALELYTHLKAEDPEIKMQKMLKGNKSKKLPWRIKIKNWFSLNPEFPSFLILLFLAMLYGAMFDLVGKKQIPNSNVIIYMLSSLILPMTYILYKEIRIDLKKLLNAVQKKRELILTHPRSMKIRTVYLPFYFLMILVSSWALASNYNYVPARSPVFYGLFEFSQLLQVITMLTLLSYVVYESIWVTALVWGLSRRMPHGISWDPFNMLKLTKEENQIKKRRKEELEEGNPCFGNSEELLQIGARCVDFTSRITEIPNRYLLFPFIVLMVWFLGQNTDFEGWAWTELRWLVAFCLFGFCLLPTIILRMSALKLRKKVIQELSTVESAELFNKPIKSEQHSPQDFIFRLQAISRGAYAPMLNQPALLAILTPMGGLGSIALVKMFFTYAM